MLPKCKYKLDRASILHRFYKYKNSDYFLLCFTCMNKVKSKTAKNKEHVNHKRERKCWKCFHKINYRFNPEIEEVYGYRLNKSNNLKKLEKDARLRAKQDWSWW